MKKFYFTSDADKGAPMDSFGLSLIRIAFAMPAEFSYKSPFFVYGLIPLSTILAFIDKLEAAST
ncbi:MAG: hypothetical protein EB053_01055 [Chlamydiae bacterium]|nr:hypothetical protein [Chlamydiota bacterium]